MPHFAFFAAAAAIAQPATPTAASDPVVETVITAASPEQTTEASDLVEGQADYHQRLTVPVTIDGHGPFQFMIDTGAQATVVTRGLTEKLDLQPAGKAIVVGLASSQPVDLVALNGLEFAKRVIGNISAPMLEARNIGADGILGVDSLQDLRVLIDFRANTIAVNDAAALGGNRGYEIIVRARHRLGRLIITNARIDGVKTAVVIDTGAHGSFGNLALKRKMRTRRGEQSISTDVNGVTLVGDNRIAKSVQIQSMIMANMPITFTDSPVFAALELNDSPALILGMRDLRLLDRLAIDFDKREVLFDIPAGSGPGPSLRTGMNATRL